MSRTSIQATIGAVMGECHQRAPTVQAAGVNGPNTPRPPRRPEVDEVADGEADAHRHAHLEEVQDEMQGLGLRRLIVRAAGPLCVARLRPFGCSRCLRGASPPAGRPSSRNLLSLIRSSPQRDPGLRRCATAPRTGTIAPASGAEAEPLLLVHGVVGGCDVRCAMTGARSCPWSIGSIMPSRSG